MESYEREALEAVTTRPVYPYRTLTVERITPVLGAEVSGVDLSQDIPAEQLEEIRAAFRDHHVLVFRDQTITAEHHRRFAAAFGELRPVNPPPPEGDPYILEIRTTSAAANVAGNGWHADGTADAEPSLGSMLYITEIPEPGCGGDTLFANMHLAYDMLSPAMRALLDPLTAIHDGAQALAGYTPPADYVIPKSEHPLVARHPETDRKLLYVNKAYTSRIPQLSARREPGPARRALRHHRPQAGPALPRPLDPGHARLLGQPVRPAPRDVRLLPLRPLRPARRHQRRPRQGLMS